MKNYQVTMVNPQQIVSKGLKGCSSTRTVMSFAKKYGVPCVWWSPNRTQKVLLVDWPQFRTTWNQVWSGQWSSPTNFRSFGYGSTFTTNYRPSTGNRTTSSSRSTAGHRTTTGTRTSTKTNTRRSYAPHRSTTRKTNYRTSTYTKRTRRAA